jgi:hypothetical protein
VSKTNFSAAAKLTLTVWLALFATLAVSFLFWRIDYIRPHAAWAVVSLGVIGVPLIGLLIAAGWRLINGPRRGAALGWLLVGVTPLVWMGTYMTDLGLRQSVREPIAFGAPVRTIMVWASSVMDFEARIHYPRWTYGRYAILLDRGETPEASRLVAEMDTHIESMATLLGQQVPHCKYPWVRGPLVGRSGIAVGLWALCDDPTAPGELTYLDRHEVAHTLITSLAGTDHYPPFLLIEGWAESQSLDHDQMISTLRDNRLMGECYSLEELVGERWYYTGSGPVYWQGGPLVNYLMEQYGPETFFELYRGVRPRTFSADCERILGDSWTKVESDFWEWFDREVKRVEQEGHGADGIPPTRVILGEGASEQDWQDLVDGYRTALPDLWPELPSEIAVGVVTTETATGRCDVGDDGEERYTASLLSQQGSLWYEVVGYQGETSHGMATPSQSAVLNQTSGSPTLYGWVEGPESAERVRRQGANAYNSLMTSTDPAVYLPLRQSSHRPGTYTIHELVRPETDGEGLWKVVYSWRAPGREVQRAEIELDPAVDWRIVRFRSSSPTGNPRSQVKEVEYQKLDEAILPARVKTHTEYRWGYAYSEQQTWQPLTPEEQQALKRRVEESVQRGPEAQGPFLATIRRLLMAAAAGWPLLGVILIGIRRGRSKVACD